jgi:hypothetical protein
MRVPILLLEVDGILSKYVVVQAIEVDPVPYILELVLHAIQ